MQKFAIQNYIDDHGQVMSAMAAKYEIGKDELVRLMKASGSFIVPVPLIGDFSCGKSSLLNAIVGEKLLSTDINPTTAIPAELYAADSESYTLLRPGAAPEVLGKAQFSALQKSIEQEATDAAASSAPQSEQEQPKETTYLSIGHPAANLKRWPHLRLVDLPGLGAGNARHKLAIDGYASRSLAYVLVVPCDEGTLKQSVQNALCELGAHGLPVVCVISKCDERPSEDIDAVTREIAAQAEKALGRPPLRVVHAARGDVQSVIDALVQLEQQSEAICGRALGKPLAQVLRDVQQRQRLLIEKAERSAEELKEDKATAEREAAAFDQRITERSQKLQSELPRIHDRIMDDMGQALAAHTDRWISALLDGRSTQVQTQMENATRQVLQESFGTDSDFARALQGYLEDLTADMPASFDPGHLVERITIDSVALPESSNQHALEGAAAGTALGGALAPLITNLLTEGTAAKAIAFAISRALPAALAGPIGGAIAILTTVLGFWLGGKQDEIERARQHEAARDEARSALENAYQSVLSAVAPKLLEAMQQQVADVQRLVQRDADARLAQYTQTLEQIEQGQHQSEAEQQQLAADLEQTSTWLNAVTAFPGAAA